MNFVRLRSRLIVGIIVLGILAIVVPPFWSYIRKEQYARQFEANAKARLSPGSVQEWATNLLSRAQNGRVSASLAGIDSTNPMLSLYPGEPSIFIDGSDEAGGRWVQVTWGGGMIGSFGLAVGSTNFQTSAGKPWIPGVYILSQR